MIYSSPQSITFISSLERSPDSSHREMSLKISKWIRGRDEPRPRSHSLLCLLKRSGPGRSQKYRYLRHVIQPGTDTDDIAVWKSGGGCVCIGETELAVHDWCSYFCTLQSGFVLVRCWKEVLLRHDVACGCGSVSFVISLSCYSRYCTSSPRLTPTSLAMAMQ